MLTAEQAKQIATKHVDWLVARNLLNNGLRNIWIGQMVIWFADNPEYSVMADSSVDLGMCGLEKDRLSVEDIFSRFVVAMRKQPPLLEAKPVNHSEVRFNDGGFKIKKQMVIEWLRGKDNGILPKDTLMPDYLKDWARVQTEETKKEMKNWKNLEQEEDKCTLQN